MSSTDTTLGELEADIQSTRLEKAAHEEELRQNPTMVMNRPSRYRFLRDRIERLGLALTKLEERKRASRDYLAWEKRVNGGS
jgi:hypothetical protein